MNDPIDDIYRKKLLSEDILRSNVRWDINSSWHRFSEKRKRTMRITLEVAVAIFLPIIVTLMTFFITNGGSKSAEPRQLTEQERRAKLNEMEEKMSGTYIPDYYCEVCRRTTINYLQIVEKDMGKTEFILTQ